MTVAPISGPREHSNDTEGLGPLFAEPVDTRLDVLTGHYIESPTAPDRAHYWRRLAILLMRQSRELAAELDRYRDADADDDECGDQECEGCDFLSRSLDGAVNSIVMQAARIDQLEAIADRYDAIVRGEGDDA